ncbi:sigma-70 family RNA polymerase sigma factor [Haloechinothrix sp. LS1_15]|uniref:sigma-70 family RNA polymerase sigma factor n=1 Tax=Haloechinothrix sp. LS1_15 TaxID=2652248 RepID=UPI002945EE96|nr:sigma-70 family RNA polymerase sigma factor [Haloechinothrix sp. LS1_15]MDV6012628.1 sigma-70 family RNA polymerase sigma factor [Haloechinothrix sp. LS1_15]
MTLHLAYSAAPAEDTAGDLGGTGDKPGQAAGRPRQRQDEQPPDDTASGEAWELVHAAQAGDTAAFGKLYDQYVDTVFRYVLFRLGNRELAEDVTSETFLRALRRISSVTYQGRDVGAWFVTIARNLILDHVKSSRAKREVVTSELAESGPAVFTATDHGSDAGPEQQVMALATKDELFRCIDALGDDQRDCIVLRFIQGMSVAETAEIMQRNEGAIKALQHRAVRRLAHLLPNGFH